MQLTQLIIAATALAGALALVIYAAPAFAEVEKQPKPCLEYCETGAQFIADYAEAHNACKGDRACINQKMQDLGWTTGGNLPR